MTTKQEQILKLWEKEVLRHLTYQEIANKVKTSKSYVYKTIKKYK